MKSFRENPDGAENQAATKQYQRDVFAAKMAAKVFTYPEEVWLDTDLVGDGEPHENWQHYVHEKYLSAIQKIAIICLSESPDKINEILREIEDLSPA